jgi:hypothetical protein
MAVHQNKECVLEGQMLFGAVMFGCALGQPAYIAPRPPSELWCSTASWMAGPNGSCSCPLNVCITQNNGVKASPQSEFATAARSDGRFACAAGCQSSETRATRVGVEDVQMVPITYRPGEKRRTICTAAGRCGQGCRAATGAKFMPGRLAADSF